MKHLKIFQRIVDSRSVDIENQGSISTAGSFPPERRYGYDVLRILCALTVCIYHFAGEMVPLIQASVPSQPLFLGVSLNVFGTNVGTGGIAVGLFFMLSGALSAKTLDKPAFNVIRYYKHRALRLLPPLWLSWFVACLWRLAAGSTLFVVPAWRFIFTLTGIDGYVLSQIGVQTFYLVGEWFYGALIVVTLLWPLVRFVYRFARGRCLVLILIAEVLAVPLLRDVGIEPWRASLVCLANYTIGAVIATSPLCQRARAIEALSLLGIIIGFTFDYIDLIFRYQLICAGVFALVELREQTVAAQNRNSSKKTRRIRRVLARLSGLTLYFFMFQHIVEHAIVTTIAPSLGPSFGTFDYWGLIIIVLLLTLLVALFMSKLEGAIGSLLS